jgi:hypothetical protein
MEIQIIIHNIGCTRREISVPTELKNLIDQYCHKHRDLLY